MVDVAESFLPGFSDPNRLVLQLPMANFILQALEGSQGRLLHLLLSNSNSFWPILE